MNIDEFKKLIKFTTEDESRGTRVFAEIHIGSSVLIHKYVRAGEGMDSAMRHAKEKLVHDLAGLLFDFHIKEVNESVRELLIHAPPYSGINFELAQRVLRAATRQPDITIRQFLNKSPYE